MNATLLNCTLKPGGDPSSTDVLLSEVASALGEHGVECHEPIRVVDADVAPGVSSDEGPGDGWPAIREQILHSEILVVGTPIWLGHPGSVAQRVLERLDAFLDEQPDMGTKWSPRYVRIMDAIPVTETQMADLAASVGENGRHVGDCTPGGFGQGPPLGPEVMKNSELELIGGVPDHGVKVAVVL